MKQKITTLLVLIATLCMMACNSTAVFDEHKDKLIENEKVWRTMIEWSLGPSSNELTLLGHEMEEQFGDNYMTIENLKKYNGPYKSTAEEFLKSCNETKVSFSRPRYRKLKDSERHSFDGANQDEKYWCFKELNTGIHNYAQFDPNDSDFVYSAYNVNDLQNWIQKLKKK